MPETSMAETPPPFDAELAAALDALPFAVPPLTAEMIPVVRSLPPFLPFQDILRDAGVRIRDVEIPTRDGARITVSVLEHENRTGPSAGLYLIHGGGMVSGDRWMGTELVIDWIVRLGLVVVTVDYRLAPEHPDPTPVEDCYAGLAWMAAHADELGIAPERILVMGGSAGGGLAAGTTLLARDRRGPAILGQLLMCPMLDDRDDTVSTRQFDEVGTWTRVSNTTGWTALLGDRRGTADVSIYAAPARAGDVSGLPPTYIDCGSADLFRDEDVTYASRIWAAGGDAELHIWAGAFHGFDGIAPAAAVSRAAMAARTSWLERILQRTAPASPPATTS